MIHSPDEQRRLDAAEDRANAAVDRRGAVEDRRGAVEDRRSISVCNDVAKHNIEDTLIRLNEALEEQEILASRVTGLRSTNRLLGAIVGVCLLLIVAVGGVAALAWSSAQESHQAIDAALDANARISANIRNLSDIRIDTAFRTCVTNNRIQAFQRDELVDDAEGPITGLDDITNFNTLLPDLQGVLVLLAERNEAERLEAVEKLAEFDKSFSPTDCEAAREASLARTAEVLADDPND